MSGVTLLYMEQINNKVLLVVVIQNPWFVFFWSFFFVMMLHVSCWPSSSFANYILLEYIPLSFSLDKVLFSFSLFLLKL